MGIRERLGRLSAKTLGVIAALVVLATAATVGYLSNMATVSATVTSPFEIKTESTTMGTCTDTSCTITGLHGGDSFTVVGTLENKANNPIPASTKVICEDGLGTMSCAQMELRHSFVVIGGPNTGYEHDDGALPCTDVSGTAVYTVQPGYTFPVGHKSRDTFVATVVPTFFGDLNCRIQALPISS
ncbi:MAG: hypothetical protein N3E51_03475 [Candidatus Micrarchaeota archaeon]|nr:hypothetical protein [Candidatus Micrarchaeota archaeon]